MLRRFLRPTYAALCLALALLAVLPPPTYRLWQLSILVTEHGHWLALAALLALLPGWRRSRGGRVAAVLAAIAAALALSPLARALAAARAARAELADAVGESADAGAPLRVWPLLAGVEPPEILPETHQYTATNGQQLRLDVYREPARTAELRPLVVVIHGGSWRGGDRRQLPKLNSYLADWGYVVVSIDYRLAPAHPYPAALADVTAAVAHLKARAAALGIDSTRIVLLGRSAGGHLALLAAYTRRDPAIRGAVSYYGPTDLRWGWHHPSPPRVYDSRGVLRDFLSGPLGQRGAVYDEASPIRHVASGATHPQAGNPVVPTLLIHGGRDPLVFDAHAAMLAGRLRAAGARVAYVRLPWATHGCDFAFNGPCGQISTWAVNRFLERVLR